jgi:hypothetical protein
MMAKYLIPVAGVLGGGGLGFLYYRFIGCSTGTCPLTSNPWIMVAYGAMIGYFLTK